MSPARADAIRSFAFGAALIAATFLAYTPALQAGFVWDDDDYVTQNTLLHEPDGLRRIWFSLDSPSQYFPLVYTSFRIEYSLWGLAPTGYHATNVVLHALNAILIWQLLVALAVPGAWFAASIFALHPVHVESVAWVTERKNVLSTLFFLVALGSWVRVCDPAAPRKAASYATSLISYALALFAKTTACTLPAAQVLVLWLRGSPIDRRDVLRIAPFLGLGVLMALVTIFWEMGHQGTATVEALPWSERLLLMTRAPWFYLGKLLWPSPLVFSYPRWELDARDPFQYGWMLAGGLLLAALWRARVRLGRGPLAAAIFFVATLSPMLGAIPLFTFVYSFVADHYQYVASIGPIALFAAGAHTASRRLPDSRRWLGSGAAMLLLVILGVLTFRQARVYESAELLWRDTIGKNPGSFLAHTNLGIEMLRLGRREEARRLFEKSIALNPLRPWSHLQLARMSRRDGDPQQAIGHLYRALEAREDLLPVHLELAAVYGSAGDPDAALRHARRALEMAPRNVVAWTLLGNGHRARGEDVTASAAYREALDLEPGHLPSLQGMAELVSGCRAEPIAAGRLSARARLATRAAGTSRRSALERLAAAYAAEGRPEEAATAGSESLRLAQSTGAMKAARRLERTLEGYRSGHACARPR